MPYCIVGASALQHGSRSKRDNWLIIDFKDLPNCLHIPEGASHSLEGLAIDPLQGNAESVGREETRKELMITGRDNSNAVQLGFRPQVLLPAIALGVWVPSAALLELQLYSDFEKGIFEKWSMPVVAGPNILSQSLSGGGLIEAAALVATSSTLRSFRCHYIILMGA